MVLFFSIVSCCFCLGHSAPADDGLLGVTIGYGLNDRGKDSTNLCTHNDMCRRCHEVACYLRSHEEKYTGLTHALYAAAVEHLSFVLLDFIPSGTGGLSLYFF